MSYRYKGQGACQTMAALNGFMNMPAVGVNYFFKGCNLKLQAMYQFVGRWGHDTQLDRDNDDLGIATHNATVMLQYTF